MTTVQPGNKSSPAHDSGNSDVSSNAESNATNSMKRNRDASRSSLPAQSKSPGSSCSEPTRSEVEVSKTTLHIPRPLNTADDLGSEASFASEEMTFKRRSEPLHDSSSFKHPKLEKNISDVAGLAFQNFPCHLTERQRDIIYPKYSMQKYRDRPRETTFTGKLAATARLLESAAAIERHYFELPSIDPNATEEPLVREAPGLSNINSAANNSIPRLSSQPADEQEQCNGDSSSAEYEYEYQAFDSEDEPSEDKSESTSVRERSPTAELSEHYDDDDDSKSVNSPAKQ